MFVEQPQSFSGSAENVFFLDFWIFPKQVKYLEKLVLLLLMLLPHISVSDVQPTGDSFFLYLNATRTKTKIEKRSNKVKSSPDYFV